MDRGQSQGKRKRAEEESIEGASTSSISPVPTDVSSCRYDVFLSFRGLDTRTAFTDHLYHRLVNAGTYVFRDDSIPIGEEFGSQIFDAIEQSKISILIISENYASSKWCLRELVRIMDRKKRTSHIVLPIFYKVAPSDVRHLKGNFGNAFRSSQELDEKDIQEGPQALRDVSYLEGWESEKIANGREGELVEKVVKEVVSKWRQDFHLNVTKHLVGVGAHVNKIRNWVDTPTTATPNARMIGIFGMGGIGKTTLAKVIYNQLSNDFVHRCFLADIRETACQKGIPHLQKQLIEEILQIEYHLRNVDDGISTIKSKFREKKVLILLDDIDNKSQLDELVGEPDWFMAGSMIIVTTRNEAVLDQSEFEVYFKYKLTELDEKHALLLFNRHAFRMDRSPRDFEGISRDIISTMGGLPLAAQLVGSYLYGKNKSEVWEDLRKKLKNQPYSDVQKILQISYDALENEHKQIFLDIACFFIGEYMRLPMYMWEGCGLYPSLGIEELKLRCLIEIGEHNEFKMHDQLRDLGRSIFCKKQGQPPEERSGPWDHDYKGVSRVVRCRWNNPWFHDWIRAASSGDSNELLSEVRWLRWCVDESDLSLWTTNLHLPKLVVLDLSDSEITEDWEGWSSIKAAKRLKVLILDCCRNLKKLPEEVGELKDLVELRTFRCFSLREIPSSIKAAKRLQVLILDDCKSLEKLPEEVVGELKDLVQLSAHQCNSLREIPNSIGDLQNLQHLDLKLSAIEELPSAIGRLKNLRTLDLQECKSLEGPIPSEIGDLSSLQRLDLWGCYQLRWLPELPSGLTYLRVTCQNPRLPQLSSLIHLEYLHLKACHLLEDIPELPSNLLELRVVECDKLILLKLDGLKNLEELSIKKRSSIERLDLSQLIRLKRLLVMHCKNLVELQGLDNLKFLEDISIIDCNSIERLLCSESRCLKRLQVAGCKNLVEIQGLDGVKFLEGLNTLPDLTGCERLRYLVVRNCKKLTRPQRTGISGCDSLEPELSCDSWDSWSDVSSTEGYKRNC